jgi:hypothetical protein
MTVALAPASFRTRRRPGATTRASIYLRRTSSYERSYRPRRAHRQISPMTDEKKRRRSSTPLTRWQQAVTDRPELRSRAKLLALVLSRSLDNQTLCTKFPVPDALLGVRTSMSRNTVKAAIRDLEEAGLLEVTFRGVRPGLASRYRGVLSAFPASAAFPRVSGKHQTAHPQGHGSPEGSLPSASDFDGASGSDGLDSGSKFGPRASVVDPRLSTSYAAPAAAPSGAPTQGAEGWGGDARELASWASSTAPAAGEDAYEAEWARFEAARVRIDVEAQLDERYDELVDADGRSTDALDAEIQRLIDTAIRRWTDHVASTLCSLPTSGAIVPGWPRIDLGDPQATAQNFARSENGLGRWVQVADELNLPMRAGDYERRHVARRLHEDVYPSGHDNTPTDERTT